jgi:integrase
VNNFLEIINEWVFETEADSPEAYHRYLTWHIVTLVRSSGMRSGEVFGLKNRDAEPINDRELRIVVRAHTSKVDRERSIIVDCPEVIDFWFESMRKFRNPDEYLFSPYRSGTTSARDVFYHAYSSLRIKLREVGLGWFGLYYWRHWYITERLLAGEPIHQVAKVVGTSVGEIESTYSHVLTEQTTQKFNRTTISHDKDGQVILHKLKFPRRPAGRFS